MSKSQKTILIAEDEEDLMEMYTAGLKGGGFEVLEAKNGTETLEWLEREYAKIDLIILDVVMPVMDGFETLEKIKKDERFQKIPVIVFTNLDNGEDRQQALIAGAVDYFVKAKYTPSALAEELNSFLDKKDK